MMVEPFERKLQFLAKQVMWFGAMILMLPLCMWGMFLGWEYRNDECVNKNFYYILLDGWLFCVSIYNLFCGVVIMLLLCCHVNGRGRKCVVVPLHILNLLLNVGGIALIVLSESSTGCDHNELWILSIVFVCLTFTITLAIAISGLLFKAGLCARLKHFIVDEEMQPVFVPGGANDVNVEYSD